MDRLAQAGYEQYEVSNFAKPGFPSRHNLRYWRLEPYIGFGPGAHSDFGGRRYAWVRDLEGYVKGVLEGAPLLEKSSFGSAELIRFLQDGKYESVELCGVVTSICVLSNAVLAKAALPEAEILIDARATADSSEKLRQETFDLMERLQMTVLHREQSEYSRHT